MSNLIIGFLIILIGFIISFTFNSFQNVIVNIIELCLTCIGSIIIICYNQYNPILAIIFLVITVILLFLKVMK